MTASFLFKQVATLLGWASKDSPGTDKPLLLHSHLSPPFHRALLQPIRRAAFPEPAVNSARSVASVSAPPSPSGKSQSIPEPLFWKQPGARAGVRSSSMHGPQTLLLPGLPRRAPLLCPPPAHSAVCSSPSLSPFKKPHVPAPLTFLLSLVYPLCLNSVSN